MTEYNIDGLLERFRSRRAELEQRAFKAIDQLYELNEEVNFNSVAKKAEVSRSFLYRNDKIQKRISELREPSKIRHLKKIGNFNKAANNATVKLRHLSERYKQLLVENKALKAEINTLRQHIEALSNPKI